MATRFELAMAGGDEPTLRAIGEEALEEITECERRLSFFSRGSLLHKLNEQAHACPVEVDADTFALLELCAAVHEQSAGAFDVTIGPAMRALFHAPTAEVPAALGMDQVQLNRGQRSVRFADQGVAVDLGAVAKGHALDLAADVLREHGVERALLHGGTSTVVAIGAEPFSVGIGPDDGAPRALLQDAAMSVSAHHGRQVTRGDVTLGHVLDPRVGGDLGARTLAAVIAPTAAMADAWSTALLVSGGQPPDGAASLVLSATAPADQQGAHPTSSFTLTPSAQRSA